MPARPLNVAPFFGGGFLTFDDLSRELSVGRRHAVCVDARPVDGAPGHVRTTTIHEGNRVVIEFDVWGMDEGGLYYRADFGTLEEAVECVEEYIGRPFREWEHADYPPRPPETGTPESHRRFRDVLAGGGPTLPARGNFRTTSEYWLQFMPRGGPAAEEPDAAADRGGG